MNTLQETLDAYIQAAAPWSYDYNKCALFEDAVLSHVLQYTPAGDAQRFSQGLHYLQSGNEKFTRSLALRFGKNNFYQSLHARSIDFSLEGLFVDIVFGARRGGTTVPMAWLARAAAAHAKSYVEQKRQTCRAYAVRTTAEVSVCNLLR